MRVQLSGVFSLNCFHTYIILPHLWAVPVEKLVTKWMFIEVLFTIVRNWREPKCVSNGAWIKTALHTYNRTLNSNKRNRLLLYIITWMILKCILLSERSQNQKLGILTFQNFMSFWKRQNNRDRKYLGVGVKEGQQH